MILYLIRHGDPDYLNDCLTPQGKRQAEAVARRLVQSDIDKIYTSPMGRAIETALPTCELLKKDYEVLDWAHEIVSYVTFPNGKHDNLAYMPNYYLRNKENMDIDFYHTFEAEGFNKSDLKKDYDNIVLHAKELFKDLGYEETDEGLFKVVEPNEKRIAIFCHGNMLRTLLAYLLHVPVHIMWASFGYSHSGVTIVRFENSSTGYTAPRCLSYCDLSHIFADRQALIYNNKIKL